MLEANLQISHRKQISTSLKKCNKQKPSVGVIESFKGYITNFSYGLEGLKFPMFFSKSSGSSGEKKMQEARVWILGERMKSRQQGKLRHNDLIWFTYKKRININDKIKSDIGWGCLIRVAQMLMAEALKRFFNHKANKIEISYIITSFLEEQSADIKYNLKKFIAKGNQIWSVKPGQWFSMTQIATILENLHEESPLKGSQQLKIKVFNQTFDIKQILKAFKEVQCKCLKKKIRCEYCRSLQSMNANMCSRKTPYFKKITKSTKTQLNYMENEVNMLLIITTSFKHSANLQQQYASLLSLMELPIFAGCLGGIPKKARFLTGKSGDQISYLDPHYVQEAIDRLNLIKNLQKFRSKEYRFMSPEELDSDIGLSFYLKDTNDLQMLVLTIDKMKQERKLQLIDYSWQNDEEFQLLGQVQEWLPSCPLRQNFDELEQSFSDLNFSNQDMNSSFLME